MVVGFASLSYKNMFEFIPKPYAWDTFFNVWQLKLSQLSQQNKGEFTYHASLLRKTILDDRSETDVILVEEIRGFTQKPMDFKI